MIPPPNWRNWKTYLFILLSFGVLAGGGWWVYHKYKSAPKKATLHVLIWQDYVSPNLIAEFEKKNGCEVRLDYYSSNDELLEILRTNQHPDSDVVVPSSYMLKVLEREGFINPVDPTKFQASKQIDPAFMNRFGLADYEKLGVPYFVAPTGIAMRRELAERYSLPANGGLKCISWKKLKDGHFSDGAGDTHEKFTLLDDKRETIAAALMALEKKGMETDETSLREAGELIKSWLAHGAKLDALTYQYQLLSGHLLISHAWPGDILPLAPEIEFVLPAERFVITCDYLSILRSSKEQELAGKFIEFLSTDVNARRNMIWCQYRSPVSGAFDPQESKLSHPVHRLVEEEWAKDKGVILPSLDEGAEERIEETWEEIKQWAAQH